MEMHLRVAGFMPQKVGQQKSNTKMDVSQPNLPEFSDKNIPKVQPKVNIKMKSNTMNNSQIDASVVSGSSYNLLSKKSPPKHQEIAGTFQGNTTEAAIEHATNH